MATGGARESTLLSGAERRKRSKGKGEKATATNAVINSIATSYYRLFGIRPRTQPRHSHITPRLQASERHSEEISHILNPPQCESPDPMSSLAIEPRIHCRLSVRKIIPKITPRRGRALTPRLSPQKEYCEGLLIAPLVAVTRRHIMSVRRSTPRQFQSQTPLYNKH
jgi:hypothetical protein